ncbi:MAG TPA: hypothetical protein VKA58_01650 [Propionibacteriaceae bacterium]|nr:hypothetical protein [Propionibacteriaceae bacterium]
MESTEAPSGKVIYLTGSHCNNNFHDGLGWGGVDGDAVPGLLRRTLARRQQPSNDRHRVRDGR